MESLRRALRFLCLCTLWVWVLSYGAPVLAQWLTPLHAADDLHQVCSAQGVRWVDSQGQEVVGVQIAQDPISGADVRLPGSDHCERCLLGCSTVLPPNPPLVRAEPPSGVQRVPAAWLHAPSTQHAWTRAPSRAPPLAV